MRRPKSQSLTILIGCLLAVAIVCSQLFSFQVNAYSKKEVKTEQQETDPANNESTIALPSFSLPSPVHVQVNLDSYCLFEILFEDRKHEESSLELPLSPRKFFMTLFRVIISPNAP